MVLVTRQFPVPTEGIKLHGAGVEAFVDNEGHGKGSLFVTEANIAWINSDSGEGFKLAYRKMSLHAISRDPGVHSRACLYIMVNGNVLDEDEDFHVESPPDEDGDAGEEEMTEIRFVPEEDSALDEMYKAIQACSLLHPDPSSDLSNEEEDADERFEGYATPSGDGNGASHDVEEDDEELGEEEEDDEETQRLEEFLRMQLHFQNRRNEGDDDQNGGGNNGNGNGPYANLSFVPQPGQFDDP